MEVVLNESTKTVHRHESGASDLHTACGVTHHLDGDQLRVVSAEWAADDHDVSRCGRCFDDGNGY